MNEQKMNYEHVLSPIKIGPMTLKNRVDVYKRQGVYNMNKKEILEIRKQFTPANCAITRICGCYVDHEKEKKMESKEAFLSLPEEEAFKYFDIFKKTLSRCV